jgi:hypothetical protein
MLCSKCKSNIVNDSLFCSYCGYRQVEVEISTSYIIKNTGELKEINQPALDTNWNQVFTENIPYMVNNQEAIFIEMPDIHFFTINELDIEIDQREIKIIELYAGDMFILKTV